MTSPHRHRRYEKKRAQCSLFFQPDARRRRLLLGAAAALAATLVPLRRARGHTPYRQWDVFRKRYLLILTSRSDAEGDAIGDAWVALLRERLPLSRAMVSRARDMLRVASLLRTDQAKLAVLSHADARAMSAGEPPHEEYGPMPLQLMIDNGTHVLVVRGDFPLHHGYLITVSLLERAQQLHLSVPLEGKFGMAVHPGARAAALGEELDEPRS